MSGAYENDPFADDADAPPPDPFTEDPFTTDSRVNGEPVDAATGVIGEEGPTLDERVGNLEEAVADIAELLRLAPGGPWVWHKLDPQARHKLATDLVEWVRWLSDRYLANLSAETVQALPPRWFANPVVVELLTALYVAYISVYTPRQRVPSFGLVEWHERCLWPTLDRLKALKLINNRGELHTGTRAVVTEDDAVAVLAPAVEPS